MKGRREGWGGRERGWAMEGGPTFTHMIVGAVTLSPSCLQTPPLVLLAWEQ
jgi:hypothetical protein